MVLGIFGANLEALENTGQLYRFLNYYLRYYANSFDKIYVFSRLPKKTLPKFEGKIIYISPKRKYPSILEQLLFFLIYPIKIVKECNVIRVMQANISWPAIFACIFFKIPYVVTYGYDYIYIVQKKLAKQNILKHYIKLFYTATIVWCGLKFAHYIIVSTEKNLKIIKKKFHTKVVLIPNGVDVSLFYPSRVFNTNDKSFRICFVGRLEIEKNLYTFFESLHIINNIVNQKLYLEIVGDGSLRKELEEKARQIDGVQTTFHGVVEYEKLPALLRRCSCFVLPSIIEGNPKSLIEAMAIGLPCIGTNVKGINNLIIDGYNGILVENNPKSIAEGILRIIFDATLAKKIGSNARKFVENNYNLDILLTKEINLLLSINFNKRYESK